MSQCFSFFENAYSWLQHVLYYDVSYPKTNLIILQRNLLLVFILIGIIMFWFYILVSGKQIKVPFSWCLPIPSSFPLDFKNSSTVSSITVESKTYEWVK